MKNILIPQGLGGSSHCPTVKVLNSYDKVNNLMCIFGILGRE